MTLTINQRKMVHRKSAEYCNNLAVVLTTSGGFAVSDKSDLIPFHDSAYYVAGSSSVWNYSADEDAWLQIPSPGIAGTFAAGSCGEFRALSAPGGVFTQTALAGGTTTKINTALTLLRVANGYEIRVVGGAGIGYVGTVLATQLGSNSVLTVTPAASVAFDATTQYQIFGGSLWFFNAGTVAVGFAVYDRLTNAWTQRSVVGLPTAWGTDAQLVSTSGRASNGGLGFVNGTATAGAASTLTLGTATWPVNGFANFQVRIKSGTGLGQIRKISSNTATVLTVSAAWTVVPDATSIFVIEGDDDAFYLLGNNAVTMYRFLVSTNTWATLAPTAARAGAFAAGGTADWIDGVPDTTWNDGTYGAHLTTLMVRQNGRYLYCFRGGGSSALDIFDIAAVTWISGISYGQQGETFTTGSCSVDIDGFIYLQKEATGRVFRFDVSENCLEPFAVNLNIQSTAVAGDKMFIQTFKEGASKVKYLYTLAHTRNEFIRWQMVGGN